MLNMMLLAQGMLEMRIAKLEEVHSNARLIDETHLDLSKVLCCLT
jgi:transcription elongation factor GreA